jgi:Fe-Mn family superoxide dismutase
MSDFKFEFKPIPYSYGKLSGLFSESSVKRHHLKHEYSYFSKLVSLIEGENAFSKSSLEEIVYHFSKDKDEKNDAIKNNACGLFNHQIWWKMMQNKSKKNKPNSDIKSMIEKNFGTFDEFKDKFENLSINLFGSGWVWLCINGKNNLSLASTEKQNNPISEGIGYPLLGIDVWEHAYYPDYLNKKQVYVKKFLDYVNWDEVMNRVFESEKSKV